MTTPAPASTIACMVRLQKALGLLAPAFFIAAFLVFLVAFNVRLAFNSLAFYEWEFARQHVDRTTRLSLDQVNEAGRQIRDYFNAAEEPLDVVLTIDGQPTPIFTDQEVTHMGDVKRLVHGVYRVQDISLVFLILWGGGGFFMQRNDFLPRMRRLLLRASLLNIAIIFVAGVISVVAFGPIFLLFHEISFSNNLWALDPRTSMLLQLFPQQFWIESTLLVGLLTICEALAVALAMAGLGRLLRRAPATEGKQPQAV